MTDPRRIREGDPSLNAILSLIQRNFAYMEGRIDPPSSMHRLSVETIERQCEEGEVWAIGTPPIACIFMTKKPDCLYLGKVTVEETARGQGLASKMIQLAEHRARALGYDCLELQSRVELVENHRTFGTLGFAKTGEDAHEGYDRPTSITMRKKLAV
nr:GNAT family N-acetyltransferase [uncultured Cohaesibacter sp.]